MSLLTYRRRLVRVAVVATVLVAVAGCSAPSGGRAADGSSASSSTSPSTSPSVPPSTAAPVSPSATPTAVRSVEPPAEPSSVSERCGGPQGPRARDVVVSRAGGARLAAYEVGSGPVVALLLHQTTDDGCGWWPYASYLAATERLRALALDFCGYGRSSCPSALEDDQVRQVELAVAWVRAHGGRRVVLVGASMGGAVALAAGGSVRVEGVVDLSGPTSWPGVPLDGAAPRVRVPVLVAVSRVSDGPEHDLLRAAVRRMPVRDKRFVSADEGHGWGLLTGVVGGRPTLLPLAPLVADRVRGTSSR